MDDDNGDGCPVSGNSMLVRLCLSEACVLQMASLDVAALFADEPFDDIFGDLHPFGWQKVPPGTYRTACIAHWVLYHGF